MPKCANFSTGSGLRCFAVVSIFLIVSLLQGCGGSPSSTTTNTTTKTLSTIAVTPGTVSIAGNTTQQFKATGTYSDSSTQDLTSSVSWSSSTTTVATITSGGLATGTGPGSTTITATSGAVSGTASLTVTAALTSITVGPADPTIAVSTTEQFTATGNYSDGSTANLASTAAWTSSSTNVASINATGLATSLASGSTTISATLGSISGSTTLMVSAPGGNTSGTTAILVIPAPPGAFSKMRIHRSSAPPPSGGFIDGAYQPQSQIPNSSGQLTVQVTNLDTGSSTAALLASIPMPATDSLGNLYIPNATAGSQSLLKVVVISYSSPDVQVIDASTNTLVATYTSPVTQTATFSGGSCIICGVLINPSVASNQVLLDTAQGYYTMDLTTGDFAALASAFASENFAFDSLTQLILSPTYSNFGSTPTEVQILNLTGDSVSTNSSLNIQVPDSAAMDVNTNIGVIVDEFTGGQTLVNLSQLAVTSGTWTAPTTLFSIPITDTTVGCSDTTGEETLDMTYITVDSSSHTMFTSEEFGNCTAIELLPSSTPTGAPPAPTGYVWGTMPNTPDGQPYFNGGDPHAVSIFTSVVDGKLYGFLVDGTQTWVAKIDLAAALAATQIANPPAPGEIDLTPFTTYLPTTQ
jgi:hypothetical protein